MPPSVASVADTDLSTELSTVQTSSDRTLNTTAAVAARPSYAIFARPKSILQQIKAQENIQDGDLGPNYKDWPFILSKKASYIQARLLKRHPRTSWISDYGDLPKAVNRLPGPTAWCRIATLSTLAGRTLQPGMSFRPTYLKNLRKSTMLWNGG